MKRILGMLAALITASIVAAPTASAVHFECQVTGVLIVIALNGPVTICATDTDATNSNTLDATLNASLLPHL